MIFIQTKKKDSEWWRREGRGRKQVDSEWSETVPGTVSYETKFVIQQQQKLLVVNENESLCVTYNHW